MIVIPGRRRGGEPGIYFSGGLRSWVPGLPLQVIPE
jgi:hypothetical protein